MLLNCAFRSVALDLGKGMGKGREDDGEIFSYPFRTTREVDDQRPTSDSHPCP
jgi:hypothetical protein